MRPSQAWPRYDAFVFLQIECAPWGTGRWLRYANALLSIPLVEWEIRCHGKIYWWITKAHFLFLPMCWGKACHSAFPGRMGHVDRFPRPVYHICRSFPCTAVCTLGGGSSNATESVKDEASGASGSKITYPALEGFGLPALPWNGMVWAFCGTMFIVFMMSAVYGRESCFLLSTSFLPLAVLREHHETTNYRAPAGP